MIVGTGHGDRLENPNQVGHPALIGQDHSAANRWFPWCVVLLLLILCAWEGLAATAGLEAPPDLDSWRDVGFIQGFLDGNWFGDPVYAGEWRYYPPLMHALGAVGVWLSGASPMSFWVRVGPWFNLFAPLTFYLMSSRLVGRSAAVVATAVFVLFNGTFTFPYNAASYTFQPLTPNLTLPLFFLGIALIHARGTSTRMRDAVAIGSVLGIVFLSHTVAAVLLSAAVTTIAFDKNGFRPRTLLWLAVVALVELAWGLPLLAPLFTHYRLHIANPVPGRWMAALMLPSYGSLLRMIAFNTPGVLAASGAWLLRRRAPVDRRTVVILVTWIAVCITFLFRHEACAISTSEGALCEVFLLPPHHFHFYLAAAWAPLIGHTMWHGALWWAEATPNHLSHPRVTVLSALAVVTLFLGAFCFLFRPYPVEIYRWVRGIEQPSFHIQSREIVEKEKALDFGAYNWIVAHTRPSDLFVTRLRVDNAVFSVMAGGRRLVAAPEVFSNPYVAWVSRDVRRFRFITAISGENADSSRALCDLLAETGDGNAALFLLPNEDVVGNSALKLIWRGDDHSLYRVVPIRCNFP